MLLIITAILLAPPQSDVFTGDQRLAQPISYRTDCSTMASSLSELSKTLNVKLEVAKDIEDDLLILRCADTPAKETLNVIAEQFGWQWEKTDDGYRLRQTEAVRKSEREELREEILKPYEAAQKAARANLKKPANDEKARADFDSLSTKISGMEVIVNEEINRDFTEVSAQLGSVTRQISPKKRLYDALISEITDEQFLSLEEHARIVFSTSPTASQRAFPKTCIPYINTLVQDPTVGIKLQGLDQEQLKLAGQRLHYLGLNAYGPYEPQDVAVVRLTITRLQPVRGSEARADLFYTLTFLGANGRILATTKEPNIGTSIFRERPIVSTDYGSGLDVRLQETSELSFANSPREGRTTAGACLRAYAAFLTKGCRVHPSSGFAVLANEVAGAANVNLISDAYGDVRICNSVPTRTAHSAFDALMGFPQRSTWKFDGQWVKIRSKDWALAKARTIPYAKLLSWKERALTENGASMELMSNMAGSLSDRQLVTEIATAVTNGAIGPYNWANLQAGYYLLRLWKELLATTRTLLQRGEPITYGTLSPAVRNIYNEIALRIEPSPYVGIYEYDDDADATFTKQRWAVDSSKDVETTQIVPSGAQFDSSISLRYSRQPGFACKGEYGNYMATDKEIASIYANDIIGIGDPAPFLLPSIREHYIFTLDLAPSVARGMQITSSMAVPGSVWSKPKDLPSEIKARLEKLLKRSG